jgi:hypothetical protein
VFVEFAALVLGLLGFSYTPTEWVLLVTDVLAIVFTVWIFLMGRENSKERQEVESENNQ